MTLAALFKVVLVAASLGLDVFAVSIGVGMRDLGVAAKVRIGAAFATAEVTMTLIGLGVGSVAGRVLGNVTGYIGFAALIGVGIYMVVESMRESEAGGFDLSRGWGLFAASLSISLDSLGIGFSILYIGAPLGVSLVCIALAAITFTTLGLSIGRLLGRRAEEAAARWGGIILIATGALFAGLKIFGAG